MGISAISATSLFTSSVPRFVFVDGGSMFVSDCVFACAHSSNSFCIVSCNLSHCMSTYVASTHLLHPFIIHNAAKLIKLTIFLITVNFNQGKKLLCSGSLYPVIYSTNAINKQSRTGNRKSEQNLSCFSNEHEPDHRGY
jgi:hypothetical protein